MTIWLVVRLADNLSTLKKRHRRKMAREDLIYHAYHESKDLSAGAAEEELPGNKKRGKQSPISE